MQPFELDRLGRIFLPSNFFPEMDFSAITSLKQLDAVVRRDFDTKAPTGTEILARVERNSYADRYELMRDIALNLFWANRFGSTMYTTQTTRWADVPRLRDDVFIPALTPWENGDAKVAAVRSAYDALPQRWETTAEDTVFGVLFDVFGQRRFHATELPAIKPTVSELLADPSNMVLRINGYDPDFPRYSYSEILNCAESVPELEALHRWAMVLHNQHPYNRAQTELVPVGELRDDDYVVVFHPRDRDVLRFITKVRAQGRNGSELPVAVAKPVVTVAPSRPYPAIDVRNDFAVQPRIEAIAVKHGEIACTNEDLIRNSAYSWSPMSAEEITTKTGIEARRYTAGTIEELALDAARSAVAHANVDPADIGAVIVCTCTSSRLIPSIAAWLSGELGIGQTHASFDLVAACAGMPYGLAEATRILQTVQRPVLLVCVEKFSDKIGTVRPSRMIFGDGAAAIILGVAPAGTQGDIEFMQTYASGPTAQVNSIIWPNPDFDNAVTVFGPQVKKLAGRYLNQMLEEIAALPDPDGTHASLLASIELIVPHQANKTMVVDLAASAGIPEDNLYFNIDRVGNASSASIPLAIHDAVRDGVISQPTRVFAPGFGAGAVAGYAVLRIDPAVVAISDTDTAAVSAPLDHTLVIPSPDDVVLAFN